MMDVFEGIRTRLAVRRYLGPAVPESVIRKILVKAGRLTASAMNRQPWHSIVIQERETGARFAIDSSSGPNGNNPMVQAAASFYVPDSYADNTPPERGLAAADGASPSPRSDELTRMLEHMNALGYAENPTGATR